MLWILEPYEGWTKDSMQGFYHFMGTIIDFRHFRESHSASRRVPRTGGSVQALAYIKLFATSSALEVEFGIKDRPSPEAPNSPK